jgi:hypothetical protein
MMQRSMFVARYAFVARNHSHASRATFRHAAAFDD